MQHHQHATRAPTAVAASAPHIRAQHIPAMHANASVTMPAMNMPPPQQQQQQQSTHHIASVPAQSIPAAGTNIQSTQQQHMRDHHARLQHQQAHHTQNLHSATQMHKLRQQHQHLSANNNNTTGNINKLNNHQQQQPQAHQQYPQHPHLNYNHINATQQHMGVATQQQHHQQQRNVPYHNQPQPQHQHQSQQPQPHHKAAMPPVSQTQHIKNPQKLAANHLSKSSHPVPTNSVPHHYYNNNNNKTKYPNNNYNNNNNNISNNNLNGHTNASYATNVPKTILQNPNRILKPRLQTTTQTAAPTTTLTTTTTATSTTPTTTSSTTTTSNVECNINKTPASPLAHTNVATQIDVDTNNSINNATTSNDIKKMPATTTPIVSANVSSENKENVEIVTENSNGAMQANNEQELCNNHDSSHDSNHESNHSINTNSTKNNNNNKTTISNSNCSNILSNEDLSVHKNSKEKTPMCLVNELARFNKITHQYRLTNEKGPAHCKRFTVTLKLGEEEYSAEGYKIKKAQHMAAAEAIEKTKYKHPVPKTNRRNEDGSSTRTNITPTVELNALAMKLGQQTYYLFDPRQMSPAEPVHAAIDGTSPYMPTHSHMMAPPPPPPHAIMDPAYMRRNGNGSFQLPPNGMPLPPLPPPPSGHHRYSNAHQRGMYTQKYPQRYALLSSMAPPPGPPSASNGVVPHGTHPHYAQPLTPCKITLIVGKQKFVGIGRTLQQAKHDAAARALQVLKTQTTDQQNDMFDTSLQDNDSKSPISQVHEIGIRRNMTVHFKVLREEGPAHMKNFITACIVGSIITEGEGNGKKISKKRAADKMLEELKKLPPLTPTKSPIKRIKVKTPGKSATPAGPKASSRKRSNATTIKEKPDDDGNDDDNPITKLIQIQQNRKEKEPIFELISKNGNEKSRRREFIIEVSAQGMVARGTGNNKKLAKRNAAQNLLIAMGVEPGIESTENELKLNAVTTDPAANATVNVSTTQSDSASTNSITTTTHLTDKAATTTTSTGIATATGTTNPAVVSTKLTTNQTTSAIDVPLITTSAGQVPGILILRQNKKHASKKKDASAINKLNEENQQKSDTASNANVAKDTIASAIPSTNKTIPVVADSTACNNNVPTTDNNATKLSCEENNKNYNNTSSSGSNNVTSTSNNFSTAAATTDTTTSTSTAVSTRSTGGVHMKDQLLYLAKLLGFEVNFSDYPKGNHSEFLTIVTLSSEPPQICHGVGANSEESQNDAAKNALKILSELGLNCAK